MSEIVKRAADHLVRKVGPSIDREVAEMAARIVIEAMREPTARMKELMAASDVEWLPDFWDEMIEEMLK
jgi:hypothetical protein